MPSSREDRGSEIPKSRNAFTPSGKIPSPQALSTGGRAGSTSVTESSSRAQAIEAANPAGPPPTINTSRERRMAIHCGRKEGGLPIRQK
jgi:hypothetical protein